MNSLILPALVVMLSLAVPPIVSGQAAQAEDPAHQELRQLRDRLLTAMNKGDLEGIVAVLHTNVVITWHNAEVSRGHAGVRAYYNRIMSGPGKLVDSFTCELKVDELALLYPGNTCISFGSTDERFKLTGGKSLNVQGRWTGTLIKENGQWLVTSLHASTNLFDNVLLSMAKKVIWVAAAVCLAGGALLGWFIGRRTKPKA